MKSFIHLQLSTELWRSHQKTHSIMLLKAYGYVVQWIIEVFDKSYWSVREEPLMIWKKDFWGTMRWWLYNVHIPHLCFEFDVHFNCHSLLLEKKELMFFIALWSRNANAFTHLLIIFGYLQSMVHFYFQKL